MEYIIVEKKGSIEVPLKNEKGQIIYFSKEEITDLERIYYQSDFENLLKVKEIKNGKNKV